MPLCPKQKKTMSISNWFRSPVVATPSPLEVAKAANPQVEQALTAEQLELEKVQEMSLLLEERNRIKAERLDVKVTTVAALTKFESLFNSEEEVDILLADKLSKWGF